MSDYRLPSHEKLRFLKVLLPGFSKRLEVPPEFVKHITNEENGVFHLWSPLRKPWHVKVLGEFPNLYFGEGWPEFVHDHGLEIGCFLIFCYEGPLQFSVRIFDRSSCEKDYSHWVGKDSVHSREGEGSNLQETFRHEANCSKFKDLKNTEKHTYLGTMKKNTVKSLHVTTARNGYVEEGWKSYQKSITDDSYGMQNNNNRQTVKENCNTENNLIDGCSANQTGFHNREKQKGLITDDLRLTSKGVCTVNEVISLKTVDEKSKDSRINEKEDKRHETIPEEDAKKATNCDRTRREHDRNYEYSLNKSTVEGSSNEDLEGLLTYDSGAIHKAACTGTELISSKRMIEKSKDSKRNRKEDQKHDTIPEEDAMKPTDSKRIRREHDHNVGSLKKLTTEGLSNQEKHITYKVTLRPNNLRGHYYLYIPVNFKEATGISHQTKLILRDPNRRLWQVDVQHSTKNRTLLVRGWKEFCVTNMLRTGDDCEFRFTNESMEGEMIFEVCITKNSEEYRKAAVKVQRTCGTILCSTPWFWIEMSVNLLYKYHIMQIPNAFTARLDISQRQCVILKDQMGRQFCTTLIHSTRNRTMFGRGLLEFARANGLKPGDICEFRPDSSFTTNSTLNVNVLRKSCATKESLDIKEEQTILNAGEIDFQRSVK